MKLIFKLATCVVFLLSVAVNYTNAQSNVNNSGGQAITASNQGLPAEWSGIWKGNLTVVSSNGKKENLAMELHVGDVSAGVKTWRILYGAGANQTVRPYVIMPVAGEANRFVVDEKNGLFIDNQLVGSLLFSQFKVTTNLVTTRFELAGNEIKVEMTMFDLNTPRQSKLTGGNVEVASYRFRSVQSGVLRREQKSK
jgi:hypothetical protein